eukprot:TRINITY_DN12568_c1_g1_i2.p1 TRINITY_DN12568_c1_g1~~TRINITY_DN12568_c1_g1_i2.p1  ORF type:complete len:104 (-),score=11.19 TRINITY_DN12568_c1_g1_i2:344-655(-)
MASLLYPLHRLTSGLRGADQPATPVRHTFIHYDQWNTCQVEEEDGADAPVKCISNLLDGTPKRWHQDDRLSSHIENIVEAYREMWKRLGDARSNGRRAQRNMG